MRIRVAKRLLREGRRIEGRMGSVKTILNSESHLEGWPYEMQRDFLEKATVVPKKKG